MTTDAEVQTVIYIPLRRRVEPGPDRIEEEPELEPEKVEEGAHGTEPDTRQTQTAHRS
jgi:hypothetical protein